jgi:hypothetical protein
MGPDAQSPPGVPLLFLPGVCYLQLERGPVISFVPEWTGYSPS